MTPTSSNLGMEEIVKNRYKIATDPEIMKTAVKMIKDSMTGCLRCGLPPSGLGGQRFDKRALRGRQQGAPFFFLVRRTRRKCTAST